MDLQARGLLYGLIMHDRNAAVHWVKLAEFVKWSHAILRAYCIERPTLMGRLVWRDNI